MQHTRSHTALSIIDGFAGVSGLLGLILVTFAGDYVFPAHWLNGTPFRSYVVPGLILGFVVGGSALLAMGATIKHARVGPVLSLIAGAIMIGWIVGEYILIPEARFLPNSSPDWLQGLYFGVGIAMVTLALRVAPNGWHDLLPGRR